MSAKPVRKNTKQHTSTLNKKTLDIQHNNRLNEFSKLQDNLITLRDQLREVEETIETFRSKQKNGYDASDAEISEILRLRDIQTTLQKQLDDTIDNDELDYYINTAPILFQYYDIVEKGNDDLANAATKDNILKFFMGSSQPDVQAPKKEDELEDSQQVDRATLLEKYLHLTDENYVKEVEADNKEKCVHCGSSNRNIMINEGFIHCNNCDSIEYIIIDHDRPSYKESPREISYFSYKRINHLNECDSNRILPRLIEILKFLMNRCFFIQTKII